MTIKTGSLNADQLRTLCADLSDQDPRIVETLENFLTEKSPLPEWVSSSEKYLSCNIVSAVFEQAERLVRLDWKVDCKTTLEAMKQLFSRCGLTWSDEIFAKAEAFTIKPGYHRHSGHAYITLSEAAEKQSFEIFEIEDGSDTMHFLLVPKTTAAKWRFVALSEDNRTWIGNCEWQFHDTLNELAIPLQCPGHPMDQIKQAPKL